jgi:hypothetical protein
LNDATREEFFAKRRKTAFLKKMRETTPHLKHLTEEEPNES